MLEKRVNKQTHCFAFRDENEAFYYQVRYGGRIYKIAKPLDDKHEKFDNNDIIYLVIIVRETKLCEGMRSVKEMIYELMSIKLYEMKTELMANNIEPIGVKTDAIFMAG